VHEKNADADAFARSLVAVVTDLVHELHGPRASTLDVTLSSRLDRDLGIDSLGRTELIVRIERAFRTRLPVSVMGEADTVGDLLIALQQVASVREAPDTGFVLPTGPSRGGKNAH
jgi:acyl carrier protein